MCGIVLVFTPRRATRASTVAAMAGALRHRGPDDEGYLYVDGTAVVPLAGRDTPTGALENNIAWCPRERIETQPGREAPLWLAHRRLAIVDLSPMGHQPMRRARLWCAYNGEIYNHIELRAELQALGHRFESHCDTEVLLAAFQHWGAEGLARCNGMWALVIYDEERRCLFVARDRFGVKPLYVWRDGAGSLLLASEIKALLPHPLVRAAPSAQACAQVARQGPRTWHAATEFEGITRFPPGHWAELSLDAPQQFEPKAFWQWPQDTDTLRTDHFDGAVADRLARRYAELLDDAVRLRMRADVRLGTALSGGLDSSSIAALVNTELRRRGDQEKQEVFSSVYRAPGLHDVDESQFIEHVARQLDVRSNRVEPHAADVPAAHERMVWAHDTPPANTLMSSWHTFRLVASRGVVVTLDGQGADEQLAGYARYCRNLLVHQRTAAALGEAVGMLSSMSGLGSHAALGLMAHGLRRVAGPAVLAKAVQRLRMGSNPSLTLAQALRADFVGNLHNLLSYADKTSMAWSVESRMPFMDYRLVAFLCTVPDAYKIHRGWTKWLARHAMTDRLPGEVVWRRDKLGWPIPEAQWFSGPLQSWLAAQLHGSAFARDVAAQAAIDPARAPLAVRLRLLNLAVWQRLYFEEPGRPGRVLGHAMLREGGSA